MPLHTSVPCWLLLAVWLCGIAFGYLYAYYERQSYFWDCLYNFGQPMSQPAGWGQPTFLRQGIPASALPVTAILGAALSKGAMAMLQSPGSLPEPLPPRCRWCNHVCFTCRVRPCRHYVNHTANGPQSHICGPCSELRDLRKGCGWCQALSLPGMLYAVSCTGVPCVRVC